jgi:hypothetical protein
MAAVLLLSGVQLIILGIVGRVFGTPLSNGEHQAPICSREVRHSPASLPAEPQSIARAAVHSPSRGRQPESARKRVSWVRKSPISMRLREGTHANKSRPIVARTCASLNFQIQRS